MNPEMLETAEQIMRRYPRITTHIICESHGNILPSAAAQILMDTRARRANLASPVTASLKRDPMLAVRDAIRRRHQHRRDMLNYETVQYVVSRAIQTGEEPFFFVWFG